MTLTVRDLKDLQVTVKEDLVLMNLFLDQSAHMLHWSDLLFSPTILFSNFFSLDYDCLI